MPTFSSAEFGSSAAGCCCKKLETTRCWFAIRVLTSNDCWLWLTRISWRRKEFERFSGHRSTISKQSNGYKINTVCPRASGIVHTENRSRTAQIRSICKHSYTWTLNPRKGVISQHVKNPLPINCVFFPKPKGTIELWGTLLFNKRKFLPSHPERKLFEKSQAG